MEIKDKSVFVTDPTCGIGLTIVRQFASLDASIALNGRSEISQDLIDSSRDYYVKMIAISDDVSNFDSAKRMVDEAISEPGSVDILTNNTGITNDRLMLKMSEADFESMLKVDPTGVPGMTQSVLKPMTRARQGVIINLSSVVGLTGNVEQANYVTSKADLIGSTKPAAREIAAHGVRVNAIVPGLTESDMTDAIPEKMQEAILAGIPIKRIDKAEEVASVASSLAQQDHLTGQVTVVGGSMTMQ